MYWLTAFKLYFLKNFKKSTYFPDIFSIVMFDVYSNGDLFDFQEVSGVGKFEGMSQIYRITLDEVKNMIRKFEFKKTKSGNIFHVPIFLRISVHFS